LLAVALVLTQLFLLLQPWAVVEQVGKVLVTLVHLVELIIGEYLLVLLVLLLALLAVLVLVVVARLV
jgi:hypothetical protein